MKTTSGRLCRWSMELQPYKYTVIYKDGTKHGNADALSRREYPADSTEVSVQNRNEIPEVGMMEATHRPCRLYFRNHSCHKISIRVPTRRFIFGPIYNFLKDNVNLPDNRREARQIVGQSDETASCACVTRR